MVRLSHVLSRVPMIKFRKGGFNRGAAPSSNQMAKGGSGPSQPAAAGAAAPMSTSSIPDIDLPARYRRQPLSQEEIDHINGGGIV